MLVEEFYLTNVDGIFLFQTLQLKPAEALQQNGDAFVGQFQNAHHLSHSTCLVEILLGGHVNVGIILAQDTDTRVLYLCFFNNIKRELTFDSYGNNNSGKQYHVP